MMNISSCMIETSRLKQHVLEVGSGEAVIFVHGNFSSSTYFEELMLELADNYRCIAPDLRGYGDTEAVTINATRGARDWSDDLYCLLSALGITSAHFLGWSAGAAPIMQLAIDHPAVVSSITLVAPVSPFGFGGTCSVDGDLCYSDAANSGGGVVGAEFVERIVNKDVSRESPNSPLNVIHNAYFYRPQMLLRESELLAGSLKQQTGDCAYPGDYVSSKNWPFVAPGKHGPINAISPKYYDVSEFSNISSKPRVLWVRGDKDAVIANRSLSDSAVLGEMELIPDWPGAKICPAQPMVDQMRLVLTRYQNQGGFFAELVMEDVGHSPFIEQPEAFALAFREHLELST